MDRGYGSRGLKEVSVRASTRSSKTSTLTNIWTTTISCTNVRMECQSRKILS